MRDFEIDVQKEKNEKNKYRIRNEQLEKEVEDLKQQLKNQTSPTNDINLHSNNNGTHEPHHESPISPIPLKHYAQDEIADKLEELIQNDSTIIDHFPENIASHGKGRYQWGSRKIQLEIVNKELVVKVGSGFQKFVDWIIKHAPPTDNLEQLSKMAKSLNSSLLLDSDTTY